MMRLAPSKGVGMPGLTAVFLRHRDRMNEVADVLARYGFAAWVQRGGGLLEAGVMRRLTDRVVDADIAELSVGERLRRALIELGTTWIKFGQMVSLRPDVVGAEVADELTKLQATVPADPPGLPRPLWKASSERRLAVSTARSRPSPSPPRRSPKCTRPPSRTARQWR
jgi:hypothetical protein